MKLLKICMSTINFGSNNNNQIFVPFNDARICTKNDGIGSTTKRFEKNGSET